MSNFMRRTKNPKTGEFETIMWLDDYFGNHQYGIEFSTGTVSAYPDGKLTEWEIDQDYDMEHDPDYRKRFRLDTSDPSDYEKVMQHLRKRCDEVMGEWNGDESGKQEDDANTAYELLHLLYEVDELVKELDV